MADIWSSLKSLNNSNWDQWAGAMRGSSGSAEEQARKSGLAPGMDGWEEAVSSNMFRDAASKGYRVRPEYQKQFQGQIDAIKNIWEMQAIAGGKNPFEMGDTNSWSEYFSNWLTGGPNAGQNGYNGWGYLSGGQAKDLLGGVINAQSAAGQAGGSGNQMLDAYMNQLSLPDLMKYYSGMMRYTQSPFGNKARADALADIFDMANGMPALADWSQFLRTSGLWQ